jgi:hypothetical protein
MKRYLPPLFLITLFLVSVTQAQDLRPALENGRAVLRFGDGKQCSSFISYGPLDGEAEAIGVPVTPWPAGKTGEVGMLFLNRSMIVYRTLPIEHSFDIPRSYFKEATVSIHNAAYYLTIKATGRKDQEFKINCTGNPDVFSYVAMIANDFAAGAAEFKKMTANLAPAKPTAESTQIAAATDKSKSTSPPADTKDSVGVDGVRIPVSLSGETATSLGATTSNKGPLTEVRQLAEEQLRRAQDAIAKTESNFRRGQFTRTQETEAAIFVLKQQKDARVEALNAEIADKKQQQDLHKDDTDLQRKLNDDLEKLQQDVRNQESAFRRKQADEEDQDRDARNKSFIQHVEATLTLRKTANDAEINLIELRVKSGEIASQEGEDQIERIENDSLEARRNVIRQELSLPGLATAERRQILNQRAQLETDETEVRLQQAERRKNIARGRLEVERSSMRP